MCGSQLSIELWPAPVDDEAEASAAPKQSIDDELAQELAALKKAPKKGGKQDKRFSKPIQPSEPSGPEDLTGCRCCTHRR